MSVAGPGQTPSVFENIEEDFHARGERAWNEYLRTGEASSVDGVFERIEGLVAKRRAELSIDQVREQG